MKLGGERWLFWVVAGAAVTLDIITKQIAESSLARYVPREVFGDIVQLRLVYNPGAAFGINVGEHSRWVFFLLAVVALVVLGTMVRSTPPSDRFRLVALALVCGGALGNLIDRVRSDLGVVDFIDVGVGALRWPTFNVADIAVSCGAVALAISLWLEGRATADVADEASDTADSAAPSG